MECRRSCILLIGGIFLRHFHVHTAQQTLCDFPHFQLLLTKHADRSGSFRIRIYKSRKHTVSFSQSTNLDLFLFFFELPNYTVRTFFFWCIPKTSALVAFCWTLSRSHTLCESEPSAVQGVSRARCNATNVKFLHDLRVELSNQGPKSWAKTYACSSPQCWLDMQKKKNTRGIRYANRGQCL
jgi:hypothetical protein